MNLEIKGTTGAALEDPEVTFTVDVLSKGYFTMIVAIDWKGKAPSADTFSEPSRHFFSLLHSTSCDPQCLHHPPMVW